MDLDAAMARRIKAAKKASPQARNFKGPVQVNTAEPAFGIVQKLGGVREVARYIGRSPGTVSRWCKAEGEHDSGGGVIPQEYHEALIQMGKEKLVRIPKNAFTK